jgi:AcrR family transcriptional regulator
MVIVIRLDIDVKFRFGGNMVMVSGARSARGERTRAGLVTAAQEVFESKGYLDARVADIASAAGVGHGTFYTYFDSKEAVFRAAADAVVREMYGDSSIPPVALPIDPVARITEVNRRYFATYRRHARMLANVDQVATMSDDFRLFKRDFRRAFIERVARGITRLQDQGLADRSLDARTAAYALGSMVEEFAHVWLGLGHPVDEDLALTTLTRLWAQSLGLSVD